MLVAQLLPFIKSLCSRKWTDEDIVEDVQFLRDELTANFESLTYAFFLTSSCFDPDCFCTGPGKSTQPSWHRAILSGHPYTSRTCFGRRTPASSVIRIMLNLSARFVSLMTLIRLTRSILYRLQDVGQDLARVKGRHSTCGRIARHRAAREIFRSGKEVSSILLT